VREVEVSGVGASGAIAAGCAINRVHSRDKN
jgi:hypothetical protein